MVVESEPEGPSLHRKLQQILWPHGLEAQIGPRGSVLVVKREEAPILVTLESPNPRQPAFGRVEILASVTSEEPIDHVELRVDGEPVGVVRRPPYRVVVDVGEENVDRSFEAIARGRAGGRGSAVLRTRSLKIVDQVEVALKQLFVTVSRNGDPTLELGREDFTVFDGGEEQELVTFERGDVPIAAALLVDASESMKGEPLRAAIDGARSFLGRLRPLDEAMVMLFSDRPLAATPFSNRHDHLVGELEDVEAGGGTALNDHLYAALRLLDEQRGRRVVVLISDGADVHSALGMSDVTWKVRRGDALIYWIRLEDDRASFSSAWRNFEQNRTEWLGLEAAVAESGGQIITVGDIAEIDPALEVVMAELRDQYVLGYYPSERRHDGDWRRVRVRVRDGHAKVRFRAGYVDQ
jgi:Ca-activated chloride channel family protein